VGKATALPDIVLREATVKPRLAVVVRNGCCLGVLCGSPSDSCLRFLCLYGISASKIVSFELVLCCLPRLAGVGFALCRRLYAGEQNLVVPLRRFCEVHYVDL